MRLRMIGGSLALALVALWPSWAAAQADSLAALWHFDQVNTSVVPATTPDSSGNGNTATVNGATFIPAASAPGPKFGEGAFRFDGTDDSLQVFDNPTLDVANVTVEAWVRASGPPSSPTTWIVAKGADGCLAPSYGLFASNTTGVGFEITDGSTAPHISSGSTAIFDGNWHHVAGTYDGAAMKLYVDGTLVAQQAATLTISYSLPTTNNLFIGEFAGSCTLFFNGDIDEVRIWNRALSAAEVLASAQAGLRGDWHFDETTGSTTVADSSGYNNTGAVNGATLGSAAGPASSFFTAASFDGADDKVDVGNGSALQVSGGDFTVEVWVKFAGLAGDMSIVDKMASSGVNTDGWRLIKQADNHFWFCLGASPFNGCVPFGGTTVRSTTVVTTGTWYHVAAEKAGNTLKMYVNGTLEATSTFFSFTDTNSADVTFGSYPLQGAFLDGEMDEVHIWARALSDGEVAYLADTTTGGDLFVPNETSQAFGSGAVFSSDWHVGDTPANINSVALAFMVPDDPGTTISTIAATKKNSSTPAPGAALAGSQTGSTGLWALITGSRSSLRATALHLATTLSDAVKLGMQIVWTAP